MDVFRIKFSSLREFTESETPDRVFFGIWTIILTVCVGRGPRAARRAAVPVRSGPQAKTSRSREKRNHSRRAVVV